MTESAILWRFPKNTQIRTHMHLFKLFFLFEAFEKFNATRNHLNWHIIQRLWKINQWKSVGQWSLMVIEISCGFFVIIKDKIDNPLNYTWDIPK